MQTEPKYWFPAKRYGWGWGVPSVWQGWLVMGAFLVLVLAGSFLFPPGVQLGPYLAYVAVLCGLLIGVCWLKGEPPRWRSGKDERT
ncbi:MAG TPA: hypothetical protein VII14_05285 [Xanthobacteraceae bacterium]|jgi:hypothetical protein|nr:hypothetical protein [Alphaproteobacteria bacterium]